MPENLHFEVQQARAEFARLDRSNGIDVALAERYLDVAIASSEGADRREWESLFGFWRTIIRGGWPCPACGGQMTYGECSGVRCKSWNCGWQPGKAYVATGSQ